MESGQTRFASFPVGVRLAEALNVPPRYLALGDDDNEPPIPRPIDRYAALERRVIRLEKTVLKRATPRTKKSR